MDEHVRVKAMKKTIAGMVFLIAGVLTALSGCAQTSCPCCVEAPSIDPKLYASLAKLKPKAQEALNKVLAKGLVHEYDYEPDDVSPYVEKSSMETKYIMYVLTDNKCCLGDSVNILRLIVMPNLCSDLDEVLKDDNPSAEALDHAVWMASKLMLKNVVSFLVYMGAPANKYELGM